MVYILSNYHGILAIQNKIYIHKDECRDYMGMCS